MEDMQILNFLANNINIDIIIEQIKNYLNPFIQQYKNLEPANAILLIVVLYFGMTIILGLIKKLIPVVAVGIFILLLINK